MRWSYVIPRGLIGLIVWLFFVFAFDPLVRHSFVITSQHIVGAKVDAKLFESSLFPPTVTLDGIQVADPSRPDFNLIQFDRCELRLNGDALLRKSYVIEHGSLSGLRWGTPRTESGAINTRQTESAREQFDMQSITDEIRTRSLGRLNEISNELQRQLDPEQLETVTTTQLVRHEWTDRIEGFQQRRQNVESRIESIKRGFENHNGSVFGYRQTADEVSRVISDLRELRSELERAPLIVDVDLERIDAARIRDQQRIEDQLDSLTLDAQSLSQFLIGPELVTRMQTALHYFEWAKTNASKLSDDSKPQRFRGVDITFRDAVQYPKLLLKELRISGLAEFNDQEIPFQGIMKGLTTEPALYGQPVLLHAIGQAEAEFDIQAAIDFSQDTARHELLITYADSSPHRKQLGDHHTFRIPISIGPSRYHCYAKMIGEQLTAEFALSQQIVSTEIPPAREGEIVSNLIAEALSNVRNTQAKLLLTGTLEHPAWELKSNFGPEFAESVDYLFASALRSHASELLGESDSIARISRLQLREQLNDRLGQLLSQLNGPEAEARRLLGPFAGGAGRLDFLRR